MTFVGFNACFEKETGKTWIIDYICRRKCLEEERFHPCKKPFKSIPVEYFRMEKTSFLDKLIRISGSWIGSKFLVWQLERFLYKKLILGDKKNLASVKRWKYGFVRALLRGAIRNIRNGNISDRVIRKLAALLLENSIYKENGRVSRATGQFRAENGYDPPYFITLSPSIECNLLCADCYAGSSGEKRRKLDFETVDRICSEVRDLLGGNFITISGGEPFLYRSHNHTLMDVFRKFNDMYFLVFTNGTLITEALAEELAELGNVTPAISVEGFEKETDERRGTGVYEKIISAFAHLRQAGVPFGISVTATSKNADVILSDAFYDFYFDKQGITYIWQFQFLPIGKGKSAFDLMVNPYKRLELYKMLEKQLLVKKRCIADFWNGGVLSNGCIAYGRKGGYFYINWNGDVMPCVFVPFTETNIVELYSNGGKITDALHSDLMIRGRKWQMEYGFGHPETPENWLMPCSFRDHFTFFQEHILTHTAKGENIEAESIKNDPGYATQMSEYDEVLKELTDPVWRTEYLP